MIILTDRQYQSHFGSSAFELGNGVLYQIIYNLQWDYITAYFGRLNIKGIKKIANRYFASTDNVIAIYEDEPAITTEVAHSGFGIIFIQVPNEIKSVQDFINQIKRVIKMKAFL